MKVKIKGKANGTFKPKKETKEKEKK